MNNETTNIARCKDCKFFRVWYHGIGHYSETCDIHERKKEEMNRDNIACKYIKFKNRKKANNDL